MGTTRRDFLKGLMATTAVAALPVAAAETVFVGADWGAGHSITAAHMARGHAFFWISGDGMLYASASIRACYSSRVTTKTCEQAPPPEPPVSQGLLPRLRR